MICPKCDEGKIISVIMKMTGDKASLCDYCETVWPNEEEVRSNNGHPFESMKQGKAVEFTLEESEDEDQDHRSAKYTRAR